MHAIVSVCPSLSARQEAVDRSACKGNDNLQRPSRRNQIMAGKASQQGSQSEDVWRVRKLVAPLDALVSEMRVHFLLQPRIRG